MCPSCARGVLLAALSFAGCSAEAGTHPRLRLVEDNASSCPTWTEPDLYPRPHSVSASSLIVVDCTSASNATKLAATTLQGVVNAVPTGARVYLLQAGWDRFWLDTFRTRGLLPSNSTALTPEEFFVRFADAYDAVVIVDARAFSTRSTSPL